MVLRLQDMVRMYRADSCRIEIKLATKADSLGGGADEYEVESLYIMFVNIDS